VSGKASIGAAVTGERLIWWFGGAACAAMAARVGSKFARELTLYRGKSYELVAEADSSLSLLKISIESRRSELD
jgi:hypothetical protein